MHAVDRRQFLAGCAAGCLAAAAPARALSSQQKRRFTMDLVPGAIGVRADSRQAIELAHRHGFESVGASAEFLQSLNAEELRAVNERLREYGLVWGAAGLPVDFRRDEDAFRAGMQKLPDQARGLQRAGVARVSTWLSPAHQELTYVANFRQHARRLRAVATALGEHGIRFGLEYVGPKTSWTARRYPFVHTLVEARELIQEIGCDNVGLVLDSWHWYTAGESVQDLLALTARDVVACDLNDAPAGLEVEQQVDSRRELPTATGVIDLKGFLSALVEIGYDGPVRAEPFNRDLNELDDDQAVAATAAAMRKAFLLVS